MRASNALLPYCPTTRFHTLLLKLSLLPYCLTALLPYCLTALLPYCLTALLPYCLTTVLPYCLTALLPYCLTTVLPYCLIGAACASTGQAPALSPYPMLPGYHPLAGMTCTSTTLLPTTLLPRRYDMLQHWAAASSFIRAAHEGGGRCRVQGAYPSHRYTY
jgi:hypothetical protein